MNEKTSAASSEKPGEKKTADSVEAELARLTAEFETLKRKLGSDQEKVVREVTAGLDQARSLLAPELERASEVVRTYPLLSLLVAGTVGFLLGRLAR
jgi:ElaB/YqjD/DUF883 family membrane-anchored ribosome-binding protein